MDESAVAVVGGVGGRSTAASLADAGLDVHVPEKNHQLGGRASCLHPEGLRFDMDPSWYLMPDVVERIFAHYGREPADFYDLQHLEPHYRVFFPDGDHIVVEEGFAVSDFGERYDATKGTTLGLAHTLRQTALLQPSNRSSTVDGLYFTGAYTTPGVVVPMCLISGEHTASAVLEARGRR